MSAGILWNISPPNHRVHTTTQPKTNQLCTTVDNSSTHCVSHHPALPTTSVGVPRHNATCSTTLTTTYVRSPSHETDSMKINPNFPLEISTTKIAEHTTASAYLNYIMQPGAQLHAVVAATHQHRCGQRGEDRNQNQICTRQVLSVSTRHAGKRTVGVARRTRVGNSPGKHRTKRRHENIHCTRECGWRWWGHRARVVFVRHGRAGRRGVHVLRISPQHHGDVDDPYSRQKRCLSPLDHPCSEREDTRTRWLDFHF